MKRQDASGAARPGALLLLFLLLGANDNGCGGDKSIGGNDPPDEPVACGAATCKAGQTCCDASCGLCGESALACSKLSCPKPMCGGAVCGDGETCCMDTCCLGTGVKCGDGACTPIACGESMCNGATEVCCPPCMKCAPIAPGCTDATCM